MTIAVMQPYYFPYPDYFKLAALADTWIVFDTVQYNRRSWMNRNRILHPRSGWQYISAAVQHLPAGAPMFAMRLVDKAETYRKLLGQIEHYKRSAPYYHDVVALIDAGFARAATDGLVDLNVSTQAAICDYLRVPFQWRLWSQEGADLGTVEHAGHWALRICEALGEQAYLNAPGGRSLFRLDEWERAGISLNFLVPSDMHYDCTPYVFEPGLSIIDALMWLHPDELRAKWAIS